MIRGKQGGFTLIELMVVVVILAILSSIAVNVFSGSGQDAERSRIVSEMTALNDALGRWYQGRYSYTGADAGANLATLRGAAGGSRIESTPTYTVTATIAADGQSYVLVARPVAGGRMEGTGALSMDQNGKRCALTNDTDAHPVGDCTHTW